MRGGLRSCFARAAWEFFFERFGFLSCFLQFFPYGFGFCVLEVRSKDLGFRNVLLGFPPKVQVCLCFARVPLIFTLKVCWSRAIRMGFLAVNGFLCVLQGMLAST